MDVGGQGQGQGYQNMQQRYGHVDQNCWWRIGALSLVVYSLITVYACPSSPVPPRPQVVHVE